jgi:ubiquitin-activating enzyme E1
MTAKLQCSGHLLSKGETGCSFRDFSFIFFFFFDRLRELRYFLVGSGAIGCEILKNWAMMGVGSSGNGRVFVTDNDTIEVSNLNRQFLYRSWDVGAHKSVTASAAIAKMNPDLQLTPFTQKVAPDTEDVFNTAFWESLDGVQNALDNVPARLYVDGKCVFYRKSLLEPGTLGPKGNVQVVVPHLTEAYGSSPDPPQKETPICILHAFPNNIEHCLQWAREVLFEGFFTKDAEITNQFLSQSDYLSSVAPNLLKTTLETLDSTINHPQKSFDDCIVWARNTFEKYFYETPSQLLFTFPADYVDDHGQRFWSGAKRPPTPTHFHPQNDLHVDFVVAAASLRAYVFGLTNDEFKPEDIGSLRSHVIELTANLPVKEFVPKVGVKFQTDPNAKNAPPETADDDDAFVENMKLKLQSLSPADRNARKKVYNSLKSMVIFIYVLFPVECGRF